MNDYDDERACDVPDLDDDKDPIEDPIEDRYDLEDDLSRAEYFDRQYDREDFHSDLGGAHCSNDPGWAS